MKQTNPVTPDELGTLFARYVIPRDELADFMYRVYATDTWELERADVYTPGVHEVPDGYWVLFRFKPDGHEFVYQLREGRWEQLTTPPTDVQLEYPDP